MTDTTSNLGLPFLMAAQAQKHITHNEALELLDAIVQLTVEGFDATTPPATPAEGQVWAVGSAPTGDWATAAGQLAIWANGGWLFVTPKAGWRAASGLGVRIWSGVAWVDPDLPAIQNVEGVGIGTAYDATNKLAVAADATLLSHAGSGHQLKLNKALATDTASLLFQTGWSGRAEMGAAGEESFSVKVSPDGATWKTGLRIDSTTGAAELPSGARAVTGTAAQPGYTFSGDADTGLYRATANRLGFSTGGTQRAALGTADFEVNVPFTGTAVVQGATDEAAGRVMTVGYGGLGGAAPAVTGAGALDSVLVNTRRAIAAGDVATVGGPSGAAAGICDTFAMSTTQVVQDYREISGDYRIWSRGWDGTAWTVWRRVATQIVGAITGTGASQTGGIIERGSTANGEFIRFADGTQQAWVVSPVLTTDTALGTSGLYTASAGFVWTYPVAFSGTPVVTLAAQPVSGTVSHTGVLTDAPLNATTCGATLKAHGTGATGKLHLLAIGRWV